MQPGAVRLGKAARGGKAQPQPNVDRPIRRHA
jgi:hypothetical protein